jgi:hypothetical protein
VWDVAGHLQLQWQLQARRLTWRPATIFGVQARHVPHTIASVTLVSLSPLTTALPCLPFSIFQSALASHSPSPFFGSVKMKLNRFKTIFLVNAVFLRIFSHLAYGKFFAVCQMGNRFSFPKQQN